MIKLTKKKLLLIEFVIGVIAIIVSIILLMAFAGEQTLTVAKDTIDQALSSTLPITKNLEAQIPLTKRRVQGEIIVNTLDTDFLDGALQVTANGRLLVERKEIQYTTLARGNLEYRAMDDYSFFFIPEADGVKISLSQKPSEILRDHLESTPKKSKLGGLFKKALKSKMTANLRKRLARQFDALIMGAIEGVVTKRLKKSPFYRLQEDFVASTIKVGLQEVSVKPNKLLITISFTKLANIALIALCIIMILMAFIIYTIRYPHRVIFKFIDLGGTVLDIGVTAMEEFT
jgi:hypothetical protein